MKVRNRKTNDVYDCIVQAVDVNFNGYYRLRYNVGIENYHGFHCIHCIYDNDKFNAMYEVVKE